MFVGWSRVELEIVGTILGLEVRLSMVSIFFFSANQQHLKIMINSIINVELSWMVKYLLKQSMYVFI